MQPQSTMSPSAQGTRRTFSPTSPSAPTTPTTSASVTSKLKRRPPASTTKIQAPLRSNPKCRLPIRSKLAFAHTKGTSGQDRFDTSLRVTRILQDHGRGCRSPWHLRTFVFSILQLSIAFSFLDLRCERCEIDFRMVFGAVAFRALHLDAPCTERTFEMYVCQLQTSAIHLSAKMIETLATLGKR